MNDRLNVINEKLSDIIEEIIKNKLKEAIRELAEIKPVEKEFYSIKEVSYILSLSESGIKTRCKNGKIKLIRDQNNITIHKDDLEKYKKGLLFQNRNKKN